MKIKLIKTVIEEIIIDDKFNTPNENLKQELYDTVIKPIEEKEGCIIYTIFDMDDNSIFEY